MKTVYLDQLHWIGKQPGSGLVLPYFILCSCWTAGNRGTYTRFLVRIAICVPLMPRLGVGALTR